jgi:hypothetical protein
MANQNLSQFTEKTFAADADWVFVWDTAGAISKKVSRNSLLNSGTLATSAPVTISQTWGAVGQTFKALVVDAAGTSDANSASGSLLADFQVNGTSKAWVTKQGGYRASNGQFVSGNGIGFAGGLNTGFYSVGGEQIFVAANNAVPIEFKSTSIVVNSTTTFGFGAVGVGADTILLRDGLPNTLALRNSTAAQTFNVYGTYTPSPLAYERLSISATGGVSGNAIIGTNKTGTGALARGLEFQTDGVTRLSISTTTSTFKSHVELEASLTLGWVAAKGTTLYGGAVNGNLRISNYNGDNFGLLQFGNSTSSFPALKRSSTTLQARLADDSAFAPIQGKLTTDTAFTSGAITDTGYIVLYDSTGAAYKVACTPV